jgi:hypothetical protein
MDLALYLRKVEEVLPVVRRQLRDRNGNLWNHP